MTSIRTRSRNLLFVSLACCIVTACFGVVAHFAEAGDPVTPGHVSLLDRAVRQSDALPSQARALPGANQFVGQARRAQVTDQGDALYVVPGEGGSLCLVVVKIDETSAACAGRSLLRNQSIYIAERDEAGRINAFGIVDDGVVSAGNVKPSSNTFARYDLPSHQVDLQWLNGATHVLDLGLNR